MSAPLPDPGAAVYSAAKMTKYLEDGSAVIALAGDYDLANTASIHAAILRALNSGVLSIAVDLGGVTFIEATGVSALLRGRDACAAARVPLKLINPSAIALRVLELAGVRDLLPLRG